MRPETSLSGLGATDADAVDRVCDGYERALAAALRRGEPPPPTGPFAEQVAPPLRPTLARALERLRAEWWPQVPGFELVRLLGEGGMGRVYLARRGDAEVALKVLGPAERARADRLRVLVEEVFAPLRHDHLVRVHELIDADVGTFLVMDLVRGGDTETQKKAWSALRLDAGLTSAQARERRRAVALALERVARAVEHLHQRGVLHRDLKPANVLLDGDGLPHVCDYGLARRVGQDSGPTARHVAVGTAEYMAPEQAKGRRDLTLAADVWSLGAILYGLLTGRPPFVLPDGRIDRAKQAEDAPPPTAGASADDADLNHICARCLARDPAARYRHAGELADDLRRYRDGLRVRPRRSWGAWAREWASGGPPIEPDHFRRYAWNLRLEAATSFLGHLGLFGLLSAGQPGQVLWLWVLLAEGLVGWGFWLYAGPRRPLTAMERDCAQLWVGALLACMVLFALNCPLWGPAPADQVVRFYPAWAVVLGGVYFAEGHFCWGLLRRLSLIYFGLALLLPLAGPFAPLVYGAAYSATFLWMSFQARPGSSAARAAADAPTE
jgi:serine/threonine-protein kinase